MNKKEIQVYYFSVEGETEKWYLEWLQKTINTYTNAKYHIRFNIKVEKNPKKRAKQLSIANAKEILHVFDFEDINNEGSFKNTLNAMSEASKARKIDYKLG
ncbi:MAG: RloB family protein [Erysipelotrichaceae bacterium]|nr:RloB family protein [Erysipelotrichaceae bacterium]